MIKKSGSLEMFIYGQLIGILIVFVVLDIIRKLIDLL